jgi:hypothetical protein
VPGSQEALKSVAKKSRRLTRKGKGKRILMEEEDLEQEDDEFLDL